MILRFPIESACIVDFIISLGRYSKTRWVLDRTWDATSGASVTTRGVDAEVELAADDLNTVLESRRRPTPAAPTPSCADGKPAAYARLACHICAAVFRLELELGSFDGLTPTTLRAIMNKMFSFTSAKDFIELSPPFFAAFSTDYRILFW